MNLRILIVLLLLNSTCMGQVYNLNEFVESPIPKASSKELTGLYHAKVFSVQVTGGKLQLTNAAPYPSTLKYKTPLGIFWAENKGEWGGGVYYKPNDTTIKVVYVNGKPLTIKDYTYLHDTNDRTAPLNFLISGLFLINPHNSNALFNFKGKLYFINTYGSNLRNNSGSVEQIVQHRNNAITTSSIAGFETTPDLRNNPTAVTTKKNKIYVITDGGFYVIKHRKKELILKNMFWQNLAPQSVAVAGRKEVYVGIRGGYVKINPIKKTYIFYRYIN